MKRKKGTGFKEDLADLKKLEEKRINEVTVTSKEKPTKQTKAFSTTKNKMRNSRCDPADSPHSTDYFFRPTESKQNQNGQISPRFSLLLPQLLCHLRDLPNEYTKSLNQFQELAILADSS
jgi:hypothetical protein